LPFCPWWATIRKKAKSRPEQVGRGIPACSGLSEEKEKSSNEAIFKGELFSAKNNIAYPSEKSKLFLKINKKIGCIYKIAGNDAHIWCRTQDGGCGRLKNAIS
jgi:hypothetical protein